MIVVVVVVMTSAYLALTLAAIVWNRGFALPKPAPFPPVRRLMVVAAHQDDESIMAGGLMARLSQAGAEVRVAIVTDGASHRPGRPQADIRARQDMRNGETLAALASIGIPNGNVSFIGIPNEVGLRHPDSILQGIDALARTMAELQPDAVITPAFEGGHPDHDATNYMVVRAAEKARISFDRLFEACEYNNFFLSSAVLARLNRISLVRFMLAPRFIPGRNRAMRLDMGGTELAQKRALLRQYKSQKPDVLVRLFGYPDQFRAMEMHDYRRGPYDPAATLRYRMCRLLGGSGERCGAFDYGITLAHYAELFGALEAKARAA